METWGFLFILFFMINEIYILDDVIPLDVQDKMEQLFLSSSLPWIFFQDIALSPDEIKRLGIKDVTPGIGCYIKQDNPSYVNEFLLAQTRIIPELACQNKNITLKDVCNARSFIQFPLNKRKEFDNPHIDVSYEHLVVLYYVNDSDGDTYIFDKVLGDRTGELNVIQQVTPKKGRVLMFNGNRYHSSSGPTENVRCAINFNLII